MQARQAIRAAAGASLPAYEAYAVRYATAQRRATDNFLLRGDLHDGPMPLDFYFWVLRGAGRVVLVDTGFSACSAQSRKREFSLQPQAALACLGITPAAVTDVILTHLHYDHAGNVEAYPNARVHLQDAEMAYATGRYMCFEAMRHFFSADDVASVVRRVYAGLAVFHDGDAVAAPGIELCRIGGHTPGLQAVRVHTARGWVVLASDALHYYRNYEQRNPFPAIFHVGDMLEGYDRIAALAETPDHIVPGHDPEVARRYPRAEQAPDGIYRLDRAPVKPQEQAA